MTELLLDPCEGSDDVKEVKTLLDVDLEHIICENKSVLLAKHKLPCLTKRKG